MWQLHHQTKNHMRKELSEYIPKSHIHTNNRKNINNNKNEKNNTKTTTTTVILTAQFKFGVFFFVGVVFTVYMLCHKVSSIHVHMTKVKHLKESCATLASWCEGTDTSAVHFDTDDIASISSSYLSYPSCSLSDRWGTTVDFTTSFLHSSRFSTFRSMIFHSRPVHSLMLSSHRFLCLPLRLPPLTVPCRIVLASPDDRVTYPYHFSLSLFTEVRRSSYGPMAFPILAFTSSLVMWSLYEIARSLRKHLISNACILLSMSAVMVHVSYAYKNMDMAIYFSLHLLTIKNYQWRTGGNSSTRKNTQLMRSKKCHILNPTQSGPNWDNSHSSCGDRCLVRKTGMLTPTPYITL